MLYSNHSSKITGHIFVALLLSFSLIFFHSIANAETKEKIAEEYRDKGFTEQQKGNLSDALTNYSKAIGLGLKNAVVYNDMGVLYEQIGAPERAEEYYLSAIKLDKNYLPPYTNLAYFYQTNGLKDKALFYFKKRFVLAPPDDPWAQKVKEEILKVDPGFQEWVNAKAAEQLKNELVEKSRKEFYETIKLSEGHFKAGQALGHQGKYQDAIAEYNLALQLTPQNPKIIKARKQAILERAKIKIKQHTDEAINYLDAGDSTAAKSEIQEMLTNFPSGSKSNPK